MISRKKVETYHSNDQKPHCTDEPEQGQAGDTPQHDGHVDDASLLGIIFVVGTYPLQPGGTQYDGAESKVAEDPSEHDGTSETLVVVFLFLRLRDDTGLLGRLGGELGELGFILGVEVAVVLGDFDVDLSAWFEIS